MEVLDTIEKSAKKTYQKHKTEKKMGISFYLNKSLKPKIIGGKERYPVYFQVNFNGMNTKIPSEYIGKIGVSEDDFLNDSVTRSILEREKEKKNYSLKKIIKYLETTVQDIPKINDIIEIYEDLFVRPLTEIINEYLNGCLYQCLLQNIDFNECLKNNQIFPSFDLNTVSFDIPKHNGFEKNPHVMLNIIAVEYPKIYQFLSSKFPSKIWILSEYISFFEGFNENVKGFESSERKYIFEYSWYDFETGRLKRFLNDSGVEKGYFTEDELNLLLKDISNIDIFDFSNFSTYEDKIAKEFSEYLKF